MAFNLDFDHIPSGLELPNLPESSSGISETSQSLLDKITSDPGGLFTNPMVRNTNFLGDAIARIETHVIDISNGSLTSPSISQSEATEFLSTDPFQDIRTSLGNFLMHTGRLSGVLKSQGIQAPGLQQILSIGVQMQNMMTILNAGAGCLPVIGGATGLFSQDTFDGYTNTVANMMNRLERGAATVADIADLMGQIATAVRGIMDKDSQFLQNCINQLQSAALGLALEALDGNPCAHFVFDVISNTNPGGFLNVLANKGV
jgi:hypothetical protein